jgi:glycosyltransferase involved in cell wall biosynthesis
MSRPLIAIDATLVGGVTTGDSAYWTGLLRGLAEVESEFAFALLSAAPKPESLNLPEDRFRWVQLRGRPGRWFSLMTMPRAARRLKAAAYHTQYNLSPMVGRTGITTIHDVSFCIGPEWFRQRDLMLLRRFVPASARRARMVITVSESSKAEIVRYLGIPASKVVVTYNAPAPQFRPVGSEAVTQTLARLGIERPYLLTIGARWPRKNIRLAIEAAGLLPGDLPHKLVIVGKEMWGDEGTCARVVSTGYLPDEDLPALYSGASLYLCPSHHEGFGIPVVEAFACGTPVLCSAGGALREVAGDGAEVMGDMTAPAWAAKIAELLGDSSKLSTMRQRGFERASQFSWAETAKRTLEVYREVSLG